MKIHKLFLKLRKFFEKLVKIYFRKVDENSSNINKISLKHQWKFMKIYQKIHENSSSEEFWNDYLLLRFWGFCICTYFAQQLVSLVLIYGKLALHFRGMLFSGKWDPSDVRRDRLYLKKIVGLLYRCHQDWRLRFRGKSLFCPHCLWSTDLRPILG